MAPATTPLAFSTIFSSVRFFLSRGLPLDRVEHLRELLSRHGGTETERVEHSTHVISTSNCFIGVNQAKDSVVVTPAWAERSVLLGKLQDPQYYSADPNKLFSGITAASSDLPVKDSESIASGITAFGGQWRSALTNDVTHLFCLSATGPKYAKALSTRDSVIPVQVLAPHWFSDCFKSETLLPTKTYLFPNPPVLDPDYNAQSVLNGGAGKAQISEDSKAVVKQELMRAAAGMDPELGSNPGTQSSSYARSQPGNRVFGGKRIVFSANAVQNDQRKDDIFCRRVEQVGGTYISGLRLGQGGVTKAILEDADVYVAIYRDGAEYELATTCDVIIGTPAWILYVTSTGLWSNPKEHLLYYPYYERPAKGFENQLITLTNYTGPAREYLKKLITAIGGQFTPSMTAKNTCLIASNLTIPPGQPKQNKIEKAREWRIPIVNHLWLEDSFRAWAKMALSDRKYTEYPPGVDWMNEINARGIGTGPMPDPPPAPAPAPRPTAVRTVNPASNGIVPSAPSDPPQSIHDQSASTPLPEQLDTIHQNKDHLTTAKPRPTNAEASKRKHQGEVSEPSKKPRTSVGRPPDLNNSKGDAASPKPPSKTKPAKPLERASSSFIKQGPIPPKAFPVDPISPEKRKKRRSDSTSAEELGSSSSDEPDRPSVTENAGRAPRAAATAAQDRLRNVVMPDVQKFQNEMQSSKGDARKMEKLAEKHQRKASVADDVPPAKKKKAQAGEPAKKKAHTEDVKKASTSKPNQSQTGSKKDGSQKKAGTSKSAPRGSNGSRRDSNLTSVRIICTKSKPTEKETKEMIQLGASFTDEATNCTHLVVNSISRTEKFLCALPRCKYVVSMQWIQDSIKAEESEFILKDPVNEKKYNFSLAESLRRIKANGGQLFKGHTFYLTDKLGVEPETLQRVIEASGGTSKIELKPTKKKLGGDVTRHHVISAPDNQASWQALKNEDIPAFSKELILNGVLRQELDTSQNYLY